MTAVRAWIGGLDLPHATFMARFMGPNVGQTAAAHLRDAVASVAGATTQADLREGSHDLADAMQAVGLDRWRRELADMAERADTAGAHKSLPTMRSGQQVYRDLRGRYRSWRFM